MFRFGERSVLIATILALASVCVLAQDKGKGSLNCRDNNWYGDRLVGNCEIREQTLAASGGAISIDGRQNGGVSVKGWDQGQILVRAQVQTGAPNAGEAEQLARQIRIETGGNKIYATGPENQRDYHWSVSFEVFVPRHSDLSLETHNGGIAISEVNGRIDFNALNGGVVLRKCGGSVHGTTTNGGLVVELGGDHWDGDTLDVRTTNGGVSMTVPENYSANLQTGTVNGSISVDFPVTVQGRITKELAVSLGNGGATVKATTTNGGVRIKRGTMNQ
ncbi:MAG TPA: DUF4097 family beta strand repeat-containing protein [Pyrinomonadaceae bacterium]|nr:DUF4097 family beta strand repeat-containing protein [Pyrinomonadaceae bacterium]